MSYVDCRRIQSFVDSVERKKNFKRDPGLIMRHLFEEAGECSRALWLLESFSPSGLKVCRKYAVASELVDIISLCVYLADVVGVDLNETFPKRFKEIAKQYKVKF